MAQSSETIKSGPYQSNKTAIIITADKHTNCTVGLCKPVVNLDDGGTYRASRTQRWLYSCYTDFWARVNSDATGYRKILIENGDLGELDTKRRSAQLITANKSTILSMVRDVQEVADWDELYIVRGTPAHIGKSAWLEEEIGKDYGAVECMPTVHSWQQIRADVNGVKFDIAHHGSMGPTPWTRVNSAVKLATMAEWNYAIDRKIPPPDIIIRSHNHFFTEAQDHGTHAYFTPCWCALTEYGLQKGYENTLPNIGGLVFYCENGQYRVEKYFYTPEKEKRIWAMKL